MTTLIAPSNSTSTSTGASDHNINAESSIPPPPLSSSADYQPLPTNISSSEATDLFDGELGDYELNEIPSLFESIQGNQQMSAELEELGFSATAAAADGDDNQDLPFVGTGAEMNSSHVEPAVASSSVKGNSNNSNALPKQMQSKRPAAEISSDEESFGSSKARRVSAAAPATATTRTIAPKPTTAKSSTKATSTTTAKKIFVGGSAGSIRVDHLGRRVNTSTAHVQALTGAKGAAMCFEIVAGTNQDTTVAIPNLASTDLTPEEKSKFSRDRNRLHARNTRIRKKAYVDELKRTLDVLVEERDTDAAAKNRKVQVELEERDVRFSVMEEYLRLRGSNEQTPGRWSAILEDDVTLRLPNLDWHDSNSKRSSAQMGEEGLSSKTTVSGLGDIMKESNVFAQQWLQLDGSTKKQTSKQAPVGSMLFHCDRKSLLMESTNVVLDWTATSSDPAKKNFAMRGTFRAKFNPQSNRLRCIDLVFDSSPLLAAFS